MSRVIQLFIRHIPKPKVVSGHRVLPPVAACLRINAFRSSADFNSFSTSSRLAAANRESKIENPQGSKSSSNATHTRIDELVHANKVVVFMKGVPDAPQCGFSNAVVQILRMHGVSDFDAHNVLEDSDLRQGIKDYSSWPTVPQVYINGDFVGGSDILMQLHQNGELIDELQKAGISSALVEKEMKDQERKQPSGTD